METKELQQALEAHGKALDAAVAKFEGQVKDAGTPGIEAKAEVKALAEKFESLSTELCQKLETAGERENAKLSAGEEFVKSEAFKAITSGQTKQVRFETKNTVLGDATTVMPQQMPGVIPGSFLPLTIRQLFPIINVSTNAVNSLREASWAGSAVEVSEGTAKTESDITFEAYDVPIRTVAHWIKVSNQLLADAPAIAAYINTRLRDGLAQRIDKQLLTGNGTSPNISGLTDSGNYTAYTAASGATLIDSINDAKYDLWATGNAPDTVIVNPADWGAMERLKDTNGNYLYGTPGTTAGTNPFGLQIVLSNNMTAGYFVVGALRNSCVIYARQGTTVEMGYVNTDFTQNLVTIRAEERLGFGVERPAAILYGDFSA